MRLSPLNFFKPDFGGLNSVVQTLSNKRFLFFSLKSQKSSLLDYPFLFDPTSKVGQLIQIWLSVRQGLVRVTFPLKYKIRRR